MPEMKHHPLRMCKCANCQNTSWGWSEMSMDQCQAYK